MATHDKYEKGPTHGFSARGYDAAYAADRARAEKELASTMAGPKHPLAKDATAKNPDNELQMPASMPEGATHQAMAGPGPNGAGNSQGDGTVDPQGQQGGMEGGQPGRPSIAIGDREAGTPLAQAGERGERRADMKGARPIPPGRLPTDKIK